MKVVRDNSKRVFIVLLFSCISLCNFATIPEGYYQSVNGKKSEALRQALHSVIDNHTAIDYGNLEKYYAQTDLDENGHIKDMYSTCVFTINDANCSQSSVCQCWNKEHSVPSSWFKKAANAYSDLFHVVPTDARVNNFRGNMPYGETNNTGYIANNSHSLGHIGTSSFSGYSGTVFEPDDEYKGDFARNYFYMATRYTDVNFTQSGDAGKVFTFINGTSGFTTYAINLFLKWHRQDPVSQKEIDRNNAVYGIQHNRNPFIDYPYLVEYIWGDKKDSNLNLLTDVISSEDEQFVPGVSDGSTASLHPTIKSNTQTIAFPALLAASTATHNFDILGAKLTNDISLTLTGQDAEMFSLSQTNIAASAANKENIITLTYSPTSIGSHTAQVKIKSMGVDELTINVFGTCTEACQITWIVNGEEYDNGSYDLLIPQGSAPALLPANPSSCSTESEHFIGWTATPIDGTADYVPQDLFSEEENAPVVNASTSFYAVFAHYTETTGTAPIAQTADLTHYQNYTAVSNVQLDDISITFNQANASTSAKYFSGSNGVRCYAKSQIIVSGKNISSIELTFGSDDHSNAITVDKGTFNGTTWTGLADEVIFTIGGTNKYRAISKIEVTSQAQTDSYTYSRFITNCTETTDIEDINTENTMTAPQARKLLINGHLYLQTENALYNAHGQKINN